MPSQDARELIRGRRSGNAGTNSATGKGVIYDPSSYYGHGEVELGIMHMFGGQLSSLSLRSARQRVHHAGFGPAFFKAYHEKLPKSQPYHDERIKSVPLGPVPYISLIQVFAGFTSCTIT